MIVVAIIALSTIVLGLLFSVLQLLGPTDAGALAYVVLYLPYLVAGVKFMNSFCYASVVMPLVASIFVAHGVFTVYRLYMWIVKKVPMLAVSD